MLRLCPKEGEKRDKYRIRIWRPSLPKGVFGKGTKCGLNNSYDREPNVLSSSSAFHHPGGAPFMFLIKRSLTDREQDKGRPSGLFGPDGICTLLCRPGCGNERCQQKTLDVPMALSCSEPGEGRHGGRMHLSVTICAEESQGCPSANPCCLLSALSSLPLSIFGPVLSPLLRGLSRLLIKHFTHISRPYQPCLGLDFLQHSLLLRCVLCVFHVTTGKWSVFKRSWWDTSPNSSWIKEEANFAVSRFLKKKKWFFGGRGISKFREQLASWICLKY